MAQIGGKGSIYGTQWGEKNHTEGQYLSKHEK